MAVTECGKQGAAGQVHALRPGGQFQLISDAGNPAIPNEHLGGPWEDPVGRTPQEAACEQDAGHGVPFRRSLTRPCHSGARHSARLGTMDAIKKVRWNIVGPVLAVVVLALTWGRYNLSPFVVVVVALVLAAAVLAAVHHAEVVAHRVGEPFGSLVLAVAVTVIE